jgi:hypothetical protein
MKCRRHAAIVRYATLAMATALAMGSPRTGLAGQLTVTENLPNTGFTQTDVLGVNANYAVNASSPYSVSLPDIQTPDGHFLFIFNNITASDPNGFPSFSGSLTLVNLTGGEGILFLDFKQAFVPNPIFNAGCIDDVGLIGNFTESAPHGNGVFGVGYVGGEALQPVSASDTNGLQFKDISPFALLPSPTEMEGKVTFTFSQSSQAGDAITIPFTFLPPTLASVPEPASWVMAATAMLAGLGCWVRRRGAA